MSETRILKWIIPVDDQEHRVMGEFLHAEPMTDFETEQAGNIRARGEGPHEWVTIWTRVDNGPDLPPDKDAWTEEDLTWDNPEWHQTFLYRIFGTGQPIDSAMWRHSASVRHDGPGFFAPLVWHLMSRLDNEPSGAWKAREVQESSS